MRVYAKGFRHPLNATRFSRKNIRSHEIWINLIDFCLITHRNSIPPTTTVANLRVKQQAAIGQIYVDVGFWGGIIPGNQNDLQPLLHAGVVGFKCFLCVSGVPEFPHVERDDLVLAFEKLANTNGLIAVCTCIIESEKHNRFLWMYIICSSMQSSVIIVKSHRWNVQTQSKVILLKFCLIRKKKLKRAFCIFADDAQCYETYLKMRPASYEINAIQLVTELTEKYPTYVVNMIKEHCV